MNAFASALVEQRGTVDGTPRFTRLGDGRCAQIKPIVRTLESLRGGLSLMAANHGEAWGRGVVSMVMVPPLGQGSVRIVRLTPDLRL